MSIEQIALAGGLYVPLVFWHFLVDWIPQTEKMAETKARKPGTLLLHCTTYTGLFLPVMYLYGLDAWDMVVASAVLFSTHAFGDCGAVVFFWAKYIRCMTVDRVPTNMGTEFKGHPLERSRQMFAKEPITTPVLFRPSLVLVIDQLWHLTFLWIIVKMAMHRTI